MTDIVECWHWVLSACPQQELVFLQVYLLFIFNCWMKKGSYILYKILKINKFQGVHCTGACTGFKPGGGRDL